MPAQRILGPCLLAACGALSACTQFETVLLEFDSVAGLGPDGGEPVEVAGQQEGGLEYRTEPLRWPWLVRFFEGTGFDAVLAWTFALEPSPAPVENPSGFARERIRALGEMAPGDLERTGLAASRLSMVAARDPHPLNRIEALEGLGALLAELDADPLARPAPPTGDEVPPANARAARDLGTLLRLAPGARAAPLDDAARRDYLEALAGLAERPLPRSAEDRRAISRLTAALAREDDPELLAATATALADAIANGATRALFDALFSPRAEVRNGALRTLHRLAGARALPKLVAMLARPSTGRFTYDPSPLVRRTLLQLCASTRGEVLFARHASGPRIIDFVYDTVVRDEEEGLRLMALETMARCLEREVDFDRTWADRWWRQFALREDT